MSKKLTVRFLVRGEWDRHALVGVKQVEVAFLNDHVDELRQQSGSINTQSFEVSGNLPTGMGIIWRPIKSFETKGRKKGEGLQGAVTRPLGRILTRFLQNITSVIKEEP